MCNMKVHKIINSILQSCTYILSNESSDKVCLIDCGDIEPILSYLKETGKAVESVYLTHAHYDHVFGLKDLISRYPDIKVLGNKETLEGLKDEDFTLSYLYDEDFMLALNDNQKSPLIDKQSINVLGKEGYCISTPGHDVDCMSYVIGNMIFTGDSYNPNSEVFSKWSRSDVSLALHNERLIKSIIREKNLEAYPGHHIDLL